MNIEEYKTAAEWYKATKLEGYEVPLALFHTLNKITSEKNMTFQEAYKELLGKGKIKIVDKIISFNL